MSDPLATELTSPLADAIDADMAAAVASIQESGAIVVGALAPAASVSIASGWVDPSTDGVGAGRLWDRVGQPVNGTDSFTIDYASKSGQDILPGGLYHELAETLEFGGVSIGTVDGTPGFDPPASAREHIPHGGPYRTAGLRAFLGTVPGFRVADFHEEGLVGSVDLAFDADDHTPGHLELASNALTASAASDVDPVARNRSVPLWALIYGRQAQAGRLVAPLTTLGRASQLSHPTVDSAWSGLSQAQANDLLCWQMAALAVNGMLPVLQTIAERFAFRLQGDSAEAPVAFAALLSQALTDTSWVASFLGGQAEAPLVVSQWSEHNQEHNGEHGPGPALKNNPAAPVPLLAQPSDRADLLPPTAAFSDAAGTTAFPVRAVLHSVWRDRATDDVCAVFVNWTSETQGSVGIFNPWLYWSGGQTNHEHNAEHDLVAAYRIDELLSDGTSTEVATGVEDSTTLVVSVPAYSLKAYRFRQE